MIECTSTGLLYRNPKPFLRSVHAWHPSLVVREGGEMLASFDLGEAVESADYTTYLSRSADGGVSWSAPERFFDDSAHANVTHGVRISGLRSGEVLGYGCRSDHIAEEGILNHSNLGHSRMDLVGMRSQDSGRSWTDIETIVPPLEGPAFEICHSVVELRDGRWIWPMATWKDWDGNAPNGVKAIGLISDDQGANWPTYVTIFDAWDRGILHWEQSVIELSDGRLLAVAWAYNTRTKKSESTPYAILKDCGEFSPPRLTGLHGQTAKLLQLPDDRILCVYRRDDKPGLWANLSRLEGDEWVNLEEALAWGGAPSGMTGVGASADELSGLKFGYPQPHLLPDGDVMVVFWCFEDGMHNIRWLRLSL